MALNPAWSARTQAPLNRQLQRTINPNWMPNPDSWNWPMEAGHPPAQGWGRTWREGPGLANLLWLVMGAQDKPPAVWNARSNARYAMVVLSAGTTLRPVVELAALNTLEQFVPKVEALRRKHEPLVEHLVQLAKRRLACAH